MKNLALVSAAAQRLVRKFSFALRPVRIFVSCFSAVSFFFVAVSASAQTQTPPRNESERELFELLNRERAANHLPELKWDEALFKAARRHALLMLDLNIMDHQLPGQPGLEERIADAGAPLTVIAQNTALRKRSGHI